MGKKTKNLAIFFFAFCIWLIGWGLIGFSNRKTNKRKVQQRNRIRIAISANRKSKKKDGK